MIKLIFVEDRINLNELKRNRIEGTREKIPIRDSSECIRFVYD